MNKMLGNTSKMVNKDPAVKIKKEILIDDDGSIFCRLCSKSFASEIALRNHARMEHFDEFLTGDPKVWMQEHPKPKQSVKKSINELKNEIKQKRKELISSMVPTPLNTLVSEEVSYIIIKDNSVKAVDKKQKKKTIKKKKVNRTPPKKLEQQQPLAITPSQQTGRDGEEHQKALCPDITGPFECLEPSNLVADGTCHQIFFSCCEYSAHYRDEHTRRKKVLRCQVCEKHLSSVLGEESQAPYLCQVCGEGFQSHFELKEHIDTAHVTLKPYECNVCHKKFSQYGGRLQHMRMHTGERPFPCTFCPKTFTQKSGLDQHVRIHTKVKPYRCVVCDKSFCQSIHLKQHMRTHTQVSPFQCVICQKRFKQGSQLNCHLRVHKSGYMNYEQRKKYKELLGMIVSCEVVEEEVDQSQDYLQIEEGGEEIEETEEVEEEVQQEHVAEEQSEQEYQTTSSEPMEYVLEETGEEVWSIKIV